MPAYHPGEPELEREHNASLFASLRDRALTAGTPSIYRLAADAPDWRADLPESAAEGYQEALYDLLDLDFELHWPDRTSLIPIVFDQEVRDVDVYRDLVTAYESVLPLSQSEIHWLKAMRRKVETERDVTRRGGGELVAISTYRYRIPDRGRWQDVHGEELITRWSNWRRGVHEFAEDGTAEHADQALLAIAQFVEQNSRTWVTETYRNQSLREIGRFATSKFPKLLATETLDSPAEPERTSRIGTFIQRLGASRVSGDA